MEFDLGGALLAARLLTSPRFCAISSASWASLAALNRRDRCWFILAPAGPPPVEQVRYVPCGMAQQHRGRAYVARHRRWP